MFDFLKRIIKKDTRDLEQVLFDIAEHKREKDYHRLYDMLVGREVFIPVDPKSIPSEWEHGKSYEVKDRDQLIIATVRDHEDKYTWATATTRRDHPTVLDKYCISLEWLDYLAMVLKLKGVNGAVLQGKTSWIGLNKETISQILREYKWRYIK